MCNCVIGPFLFFFFLPFYSLRPRRGRRFPYWVGGILLEIELIANLNYYCSLILIKPDTLVALPP